MTDIPSTDDRQSARGADGGAALAALSEQPYLFEFFQAVRLLSKASPRPWEGDASGARPVGLDFPPQHEAVRFRAIPSHSFPPAEIADFDVRPTRCDDAGPPEMTVSFMGLFGPAGALPQHYTQTVIDRLRLKDGTLRDFLDVFNHRTISLFYRAWEKHRLPPMLERSAAEGREDPITRGLYCVVGMGAPALRGRMETPDDTYLFYSGLFSQHPRNAISLERMLAEWLGLPTAVQQFRGQWLLLSRSEQTALPTSRRPRGVNCRLGVATMAGERVWSVESAFRLRLGPMGYSAFEQLLPNGRLFVRLGQLTRTYVGPELEFDVQLILRRDEVPPCQLTSDAASGPRLGWNTWTCSVPRQTDAADAAFAGDGRPTR